MKYKLVTKEGNCEYQEWSRKDKDMVNCSCKTSVKVGHKWVCVEHLPIALMSDNKPEMEDHRPIEKKSGAVWEIKKNQQEIKQGFKVIAFVPDFIKLAKGDPVNIKQGELGI